jgi:surface protein
MSIKGTFIYTVNTILSDISLNNIPIINDNNSFVLDVSYNTTSTLTTITVDFTYTTISGNDGLSFAYCYGFHESYSVTITQFGSIPLSNGGSQFANMPDLAFTATDTPYTSNVTDMSFMFTNATNFNSYIGNWNTSSVTNMESMFTFATEFNQSITTDLSNNYWNTSNVTNLSCTFSTAFAFNNGQDSSDNTAPLNWNTSSVEQMIGTFAYASVFNQSITADLSNNYWDTSKVLATDTSGNSGMDYMFSFASSFNNGQDSSGNTAPMGWSIYQFSKTPINFSYSTPLTFNPNSPFGGDGYTNVSTYNVYIPPALPLPTPTPTPLTATETRGPTSYSLNRYNESSFEPIFAGFFNIVHISRSQGVVTSFYDNTNPRQNIYTNNNQGGENSIFNFDSLEFSKGGVNITSFPYFARKGNNSTWYNLSGNSLVTSENQFKAGLPGTSVTMIFAKIPDPIICFLEGTKILTNKGYINIQDLRKGDLVKTLNDSYKPIDMIGHKEIFNNPVCRNFSLARTDLTESEKIMKQQCVDQLYVCQKDQYPELFADLIITGAHSILMDKVSKKEKAETEGLLGSAFKIENKYRLPVCIDKRANVYEKRGTFTIYHLALENKSYVNGDGIFANGLLVESCSKRHMKEFSDMTLIE